MWTALADVLPYTTGLVLTPFALIAVIVLLVSDNGTRKGLVLVAIWLVATFVVCLAVAEIATGAERESDDKGIWIGLLLLLIGIVLLVLTIGMIRRAARRPVGEPRKPPGWLEAADRSSLPQIAGASLVLAVANPVNLSMLIGAGVTLGGYSLPLGQDVVVSASFMCIGALGVLAPTVVAMVPALRRRASLDHWRRWLVEHNEPLTIGTTLIFAMLFISKGLRGVL